MTYIFTAQQLAGIIQYNLNTEDPLVLENVAFLAELFYQDCKEDIKQLTDQPWPERLFQIVENVIDRDDWRDAYNSDSKELIIDVK